MSNLTNTAKNSIRVLDGNIPDTEGYYIVSYEGSNLNLRAEYVTARSSARTMQQVCYSSRRDRLLGIALGGSLNRPQFIGAVFERLGWTCPDILDKKLRELCVAHFQLSG